MKCVGLMDIGPEVAAEQIWVDFIYILSPFTAWDSGLLYDLDFCSATFMGRVKLASRIFFDELLRNSGFQFLKADTRTLAPHGKT